MRSSRGTSVVSVTATAPVVATGWATAFGTGSDVTAEAAGAVVLDSSLQKADELLHVS
jgi:hypothetical protein